MTFHKTKLRSVLEAFICGLVLSLVFGLIENPPEASIIGADYYGYPLAWRITMMTLPSSTNFVLTSLVLDVVFWMVLSFVALTILGRMLGNTISSEE